MNWHKKLYLGEEARKKRTKIIYSLDRHRVSFGTYAIMLSVSERDLLDIVPSFMLFRDKYKDRTILGLAVTKEEAYEVCAQMILDVYKETGRFDVRSYFA